MADNKFHIEQFNPESDDWEAYRERLDLYFIANGVEEEKKVAVLLTVAGPKTYALVRSLVAPDKPSDKPYLKIVQLIDRYLNPKPLVIAERFHFHLRNQREHELVNQYSAELFRLAKTCDFRDNLKDTLRDRFVCGLRNVAIQKKLLTEKNLTWDTALEIAQAMEIVAKQTEQIKNEATREPEAIQVNKVAQQPERYSCFWCGKGGHAARTCYFKDKQCHKCHNTGHIARMCPKEKMSKERKNKGINVVDEETESEDQDCGLFDIQVVNGHTPDKIMVNVNIEGIQLGMELDTGAAVSVISESTYHSKFRHIPLQHSDIILHTYSGEKLAVVGQMEANVNYEQQNKHLLLYVIKGKGPALLGRDWLREFQLNWGQIKALATGIDNILDKHQALFDEGLGTMEGFQAKLRMMQNAVPKFLKAHSVPYALREAIEKELNRLERLGVIEKVSHSDWATPIVPVPKADGSVRICGDYKATVNPQLVVDQYPLPKPEDLFTVLGGGQKFSKLDFSHAYQQVLLDPESKEIVTISTHKGLYRYNRLPFGVASAPAVFQKLMEQVLHDIPKVVCYLDDVLVTGDTDQEHLSTLELVLQCIEQSGLRLKKSKCQFFKASVQYLGFLIDAEGLHTAPDKIDAIQKAPTPQNTKQLRSFLGLVNYYGKFVPELAGKAYPLHKLLCKGVKWYWTGKCEQAFQTLKQALSRSPVLTHYNSTLPLRVATDASNYGIGAVVSHVWPDGTEKPIAFASRSLSKAEKNYSQIEKEALAIIFGIKKFNQYLYGRKFLLQTDLQPLTWLFGPKSKLPTLAAARIQRWVIMLSAYQYDIEFRSTQKHANADALSRLPLSGTGPAISKEAALFNLVQIGSLPPSAKQLQEATAKDPLLAKVLHHVTRGWPAVVEPALQPFFNRKLELSTEGGCLLWGMRVIIPKKYQRWVLDELHIGHQGIVKMKALARGKVWWPNIDKDIEEEVNRCQSCQSIRNRPPKVILHPWTWPNHPWQRVHLVLVGPFVDRMFLIVVDAYSKWLEVFPMAETTSEKTITVLRQLFASYGVPEQIVTDNGPQFTAAAFGMFTKLNGIRHTRVAPYHPASNGEAERFVQTFKHAMKAATQDVGSLQAKLARFLFRYRSTPNSTTGVSPAKLF